MTIKKRLARSNIAMFVIPVLVAAVLLLIGLGIGFTLLERVYLPPAGDLPGGAAPDGGGDRAPALGLRRHPPRLRRGGGHGAVADHRLDQLLPDPEPLPPYLGASGGPDGGRRPRPGRRPGHPHRLPGGGRVQGGPRRRGRDGCPAEGVPGGAAVRAAAEARAHCWDVPRPEKPPDLHPGLYGGAAGGRRPGRGGQGAVSPDHPGQGGGHGGHGEPALRVRQDGRERVSRAAGGPAPAGDPGGGDRGAERGRRRGHAGRCPGADGQRPRRLRRHHRLYPGLLRALSGRPPRPLPGDGSGAEGGAPLPPEAGPRLGRGHGRLCGAALRPLRKESTS